ncbi:MAG: GNAT family N-acetyltransferase [Acidimicrobiales bacterium]
MNVFTLAEIDAKSSEIEAALEATDEIDRWCSGPDWVIPVHHGFAPDASTLLLETTASATPGFALLARYRLADGRRMLAGLEPLWGFASPLIGSDIGVLASSLATHLSIDDGWDVLVLPGMPMPETPTAFTAEVVRALGTLGEVRIGEGMTRQVVDLADGYDEWLARRSRTFRRNLRHAAERAAREGVTYESVSDYDGVFERLLAVEERSWKGADDSGITSSEMRATYAAMTERLASQGRLRAHVARCGGEDIGYIVGGVRAGRYRGLQLSFVQEAESLSVGHLLQSHQLQLLVTDDEAVSYDLGMDFEYKRRWADRTVTSFTVVIEREVRP